MKRKKNRNVRQRESERQNSKNEGKKVRDSKNERGKERQKSQTEIMKDIMVRYRERKTEQ